LQAGGLGGLAALRAKYFFTLAKTRPPACGRQAGRNGQALEREMEGIKTKKEVILTSF
jgi:hypothetical protein